MIFNVIFTGLNGNVIQHSAATTLSLINQIKRKNSQQKTAHYYTCMQQINVKVMLIWTCRIGKVVRIELVRTKVNLNRRVSHKTSDEFFFSLTSSY